jgi:hypothetical protein
MTLFAHFSSEQLWLVLVAANPGHKTIEHWLAPAGDMGNRKILRQSNAKRRAVAAIPLSRLGGLGIAERGWWHQFLDRVQGPKHALFRMNPDDGLVSLIMQRAKNIHKAEHAGEGIVAAYNLNAVRDSVRNMRHILDTQNVHAAHYNLLGNQDIPREVVAEEMNIKIRPDKWAEPEMGA